MIYNFVQVIARGFQAALHKFTFDKTIFNEPKVFFKLIEKWKLLINFVYDFDKELNC